MNQDDGAQRVSMSCYFCRGESDGAESYAKENGFELVRCRTCGLLYLNERPADTAISQAHEVGQHAGEEVIDTTGGFRRRKLHMYSKILRDMYGGTDDFPSSWLDIGCGNGEFLKAIQTFSKKTTTCLGIEPNKFKRKTANSHGVRVDYFDLEAHSDRYDCISLLNVFSHLVDPPEILSKWVKLLNPKGEILLQTGDSAHLPAELQLKPLLLPDHISFASEKIVTKILQDIGFEILTVRKYPYVVRSPASFIRETAKLLLGRGSHLKNMLGGDRIGATDMYVRARLL